MFVVSWAGVMVGSLPYCYDGILMKLTGFCGELTAISTLVRGEKDGLKKRIARYLCIHKDSISVSSRLTLLEALVSARARNHGVP